MAEVITGEFSKYRSNLIDAHESMKVVLWDCGPEEPKLPEPPDPPSGKDGDPRYDLAKIQFSRKLNAYREALEKYEADVIEFKDWSTRNGGPIEVMQWSCDARDTFQHDVRAVKEGRQARRRWHLSASTPGYGKLENRGLPPGMNPGHGHQANVERQIAGQADLRAARQADPIYEGAA